MFSSFSEKLKVKLLTNEKISKSSLIFKCCFSTFIKFVLKTTAWLISLHKYLTIVMKLKLMMWNRFQTFHCMKLKESKKVIKTEN